MTIQTKDTTDGELLLFPGSLMIIRVSAKTGSDGICVIENRMPFGDAPPLHVHRNEDEIFHLLEGTMRFVVGGTEVVAHAGQTLLAPKGVPHAYRVTSQGGARALVVTHGSDFETMVREMSVPTASAETPAGGQPTPEVIAALVAACARNNIDLVGPPLQ